MAAMMARRDIALRLSAARGLRLNPVQTAWARPGQWIG